jgi:hypothetical protein
MMTEVKNKEISNVIKEFLSILQQLLDPNLTIVN